MDEVELSVVLRLRADLEEIERLVQDVADQFDAFVVEWDWEEL